MGLHLIKAALFCPICLSIQLPFESSLLLVHDLNPLFYVSDAGVPSLSQCLSPSLPDTLLLWGAFWVFSLAVLQLWKISPEEQIQTCGEKSGMSINADNCWLTEANNWGSYWPVESSLLRVDTASLLNIQKWPLLQESRQGLHGATTW